jgi:hypothetical protein
VYNTGLAAPSAAASRTGTFTGLSTNSNATSANASSEIATIGGTLILYSNTGALTAAAGTVTPSAAGPNANDTVTLGPVGATTVYTFVTSGTTGNNVLIGANSAAAAGNLLAAINDNSAQCVTAAPCFGSGIAAPNAAGTATIVGNAVTITASAAGAANNFWLKSSTNGRLPISGAAETGGGGSNTGLNFLAVTDVTTTATNLVAAIVRNGGGVGVTATSSAGIVTVTATSAGTAGNSITLTKSLTNFSWAGAKLTGGVNALATIGAFDNLYSSCTGTVPTTYWAYNTGTAGGVLTSPVLSGDGTQIAFIQNTATGSTLVLLKWAASSGDFTTPVTLTSQVSAAAYNTCVAPCMYTIAFSTANGGAAALDTNSSPFYDYANDAIYVGEDDGFLHKFNPVFHGAPAEITSTTGANLWPAGINSGKVLTSPVFDDGPGEVYVGDDTGVLYRVDSTIGGGTGGVVASGTIGGVAGIDDSPVVDVTLGNVYVFIRRDITGANGRARVYRFATNFGAGTMGIENVAVSSNSTVPVTAFYAGDFDNIYYSSAGGTGNMYVCGTGLQNGTTRAALWQIPITLGALGAPVEGPQLTTANVACSPVTEFNNGATDRMFLSVTASAVTGSTTSGAAINCVAGGGCIMSFDITTSAGWGVTTGTSATAAVAGGASGVVVDNSSATGGASQVYFTPLKDQTCATSGGTGGCAIQASQSALN